MRTTVASTYKPENTLLFKLPFSILLYFRYEMDKNTKHESEEVYNLWKLKGEQ